ncbi:MAG: low molecular weight phosphotyrosine protein phosphatase [Clostridia bacterium]|nr:low molecular weight phosphotyrosine protein phosphatase [Clostridia bacterium]
MGEPVKKKIFFVCFANVCRSTMAQFIMRNIIRRKGLDNQIEIDSAGVFEGAVGMEVHEGTVKVLEEYGIPVENYQSKLLTKENYEEADMIVCMDEKNIAAINEICDGDPEHKVFKLMSFAGKDEDVPDPWYTDNFDETYDAIIEGCRGLMNYLA